jgi:hypothetical protein
MKTLLILGARIAQCPVLLLLVSCYTAEETKVTDDPTHVGSYRKGQVFSAQKDIWFRRDHGGLELSGADFMRAQAQGSLLAGVKLQVGDAYRYSHINICYTYIEARVLDGPHKGSTVLLRGISKTSGDQNASMEVLVGPDPDYLKLSSD